MTKIESLPTSFPVKIDRYGWGCLLTVPFSLMIIAWLAFIFSIWYKTPVLQKEVLFNCSMGFCALFGIAVWFFGVRTQYTEKIEITEMYVSYFRKGLMRITKQWEEPLANYNGIATNHEIGIEKSGVDSENEIDLFLVVLQHQNSKRKNIVLEKNALDQDSQSKIQGHYAKLLKLEVLN